MYQGNTFMHSPQEVPGTHDSPMDAPGAPEEDKNESGSVPPTSVDSLSFKYDVTLVNDLTREYFSYEFTDIHQFSKNLLECISDTDDSSPYAIVVGV